MKRAIAELDLVHLARRRWYYSWSFRGAALAAIVLGAVGLNFLRGDTAFLPGAKESVEAADLNEGYGSDTAGRLSEKDFDRRIGTLSRPLTRRGAAAVLLDLWGCPSWRSRRLVAG